MAVENPNTIVDAYRIQAPAEAAFVTVPATCCCFIKASVSGGDGTNIILFDNVKTAPGGTRAGKRLRMNAANVRWTHATAGGSNTKDHAHGGFSGWHFAWGRTDAAGTGITVGFDGGSSSGTFAAAVSQSNGNPPTVLNSHDGAFEGDFTLGGLWFWDRALTDDEVEAVRLSGGRTLPRNGLVTELRMLDNAPGTDTDDTVPRDGVDPSRAWAAVGSGTAYNHVEGNFPLRSRPR